MSHHRNHSCGCRVETRQIGVVGDVLCIRPCARHLGNDNVQGAMQALDQALVKAHAELPPMQIEQEERAASGDRYR